MISIDFVNVVQLRKLRDLDQIMSSKSNQWIRVAKDRDSK